MRSARTVAKSKCKTKTTAVKPERKNAAFKHLMFMHWVMAACFLMLYVTGVFVPRLPQNPILAGLIPFLHQSLGTLAMLLLIARIFLLIRVVGPKYSRCLPKATPVWWQTFVLKFILYVFMLIAPISGFFLRDLQGIDTTCFGILMPPLFGENEPFVELARSSHFWSSYLFLSFIILHVLAQWKVIRSYWRRIHCSWRSRALIFRRERY